MVPAVRSLRFSWCLALPAALALGAAGLPAGAQEPTPATPVFDATSRRVLVDLVVTDKKHRPVLGLATADFRVFEDGVEREILSFAAFGPDTAAEKAPAPDAGGTAAPVRSGQASTVLLIDEAHLSPMEAAQLRPALSEVLLGLEARRGWVLVLAPWSNVAFEGRLPEDAAGLNHAAGLIRGLRAPQISKWPMTDSEALDIERGDTLATRRLVERFRYLNPGLERQMVSLVKTRATELVVAARARRRDTFEAIRLALWWLRRQPGRHSVLMLTPGFPHDPADEAFSRLVNESLKLNAPIHFLDVSDPSAFNTFEGIAYGHALPEGARVAPFESADASEGPGQLAVNTGGVRVGSSDVARGLARILDATQNYYLLGYEPVPRKKPGFRKIRVEVRRKGLRVLARRGYFDEGKAAGPVPTVP
jgi:VWFA-related protein